MLADAFGILFPIFLLIGLGFLAGRLAWFDEAGFRAMGAFVFLIALPAAVFNGISAHPFAEIFDPHYLAVYGGAALGVFVLIYLIFWRIRPEPPAARAFAALGASASNSGFIGYPIALQALGPIAGVALGLCMLIENLVTIPLALFLAERQSHTTRDAFLLATKRVFKTPLVWAAIGGFAVSAAGIVLPELARRPIELLAASSAPLALVFIGGMLASARVESLRPDMALVALGKLVLMPLAAYALLLVFQIENPDLRRAAIIFASTPVITVFPLLGAAFGLERENAAYLVLSTAIAALTLCAVLALTI